MPVKDHRISHTDPSRKGVKPHREGANDTSLTREGANDTFIFFPEPIASLGRDLSFLSKIFQSNRSDDGFYLGSIELAKIVIIV